MIGTLAYRARAPRHARVFLMTHPGAIRSPQVVHFLKHLRRHIRGPVVLLWDGLHAHRSVVTREHVEAQNAWLTLHRLPAYAPELNPVEGLWAWFKGTAANLCPDSLAPVRRQLRLGRHPGRLWGFLHKAGLFV